MNEGSRQGYTEAFKIQVVREIEEGRSTPSAASRRYGILGHSTILKWCRKYGRRRYAVHHGEKRTGMEEHEMELLQLRNENRALKEELDAARQKNVILETLVDVAERELAIPIRKKYGAKRSGK